MIKKICFFTTHFDFPRQNYMDYYEKILPRRIQLFLFCEENSKKKFNLDRAKVITYSCNKLQAAFKLRKFCKENHIDVIINLSGTSEVSFALIIATIFTKTKNVFYFHGNPDISLKNSLFFISQFFTDRFLVSAFDITEKVKKYLLFSRKKTFHLPLTVNPNIFKLIDKKKCRKRLNLGLKEKIIVSVGRISFLKGSDFLLKIIKNNPDKKFILIGELIDEEYKKQKLKNLLLISFKNSEELVYYYNAADLLVTLSRIEGFGLTPREAMACGTPTLVSDIESLRLIKPAIKVPFDIEKIQKKLDDFFNLSEKKIKELSKKSRDFVINECSEDKVRPLVLKYFLNF